MKRALGASEPPGTPMMKLQSSPNKVSAPATPQNKESHQPDKPQTKDPPSAEAKIKETSALGSPQRKPPLDQSAKSELVKKPEGQKQVGLDPGQKTPQEGRKLPPQKPSDHTGQAVPGTTSTAPQGDSGGFFGFSSSKPQPDAAKQAESLGGKMFGFGSSIFSSASTLINQAVQDESKTTPPVSPKMPGAKAAKSPLTQKKGQDNKLQQVQQPKPSPSSQAKVEKAQSDPPKHVSACPGISKAGKSTCPLCKVELNIGSKDPPNYNNCTECKNTVCNQCGFNPMPNVSQVIKA